MTLKNSFLADGQENKKTENKKYGNTFFTDAWENDPRDAYREDLIFYWGEGVNLQKL